MKTKKRLLVMILLYWQIVGMSSCFTYRITGKNSDPATEYQSKTVHSFFWGAANTPPTFIASNCDPTGLDEVTVKTNVGYSLITIFTLGIWAPIELKWRCSKPCQRVGNI